MSGTDLEPVCPGVISTKELCFSKAYEHYSTSKTRHVHKFKLFNSNKIYYTDWFAFKNLSIVALDDIIKRKRVADAKDKVLFKI